MRKWNLIRFCLLLMIVILFNVYTLTEITLGVQRINCFSYEKAWYHFRNMTCTMEQLCNFYEASECELNKFAELLTMYCGMEQSCTDAEALEQQIAVVKSYQEADFLQLKTDILAIFDGAYCFPVGEIENKEEAGVSFYDTWNQSRSFGGERLHEGCDIMASENKRGIYPVYSVCDGVVDKIGWLELGGYRIGIRDSEGVYYYYAHLEDYATDFVVGDEVKAGTLLGFMGDTGYGEEGTTGMFDVHLHFGVYVTDDNGAEVSVNSYPLLSYLWNYGYNELKD